MINLTPVYQEVAAMLVGLQMSTGNEHYWATDCEQTIFQNSGVPNYVLPTPGLQGRYATPGAKVSYHHSHPDERSLSPSDLNLLVHIGVVQVWAHTPEGGSYGAELRNEECRNQFQDKFDILHGHMSAEILRLNGLPNLTNDEFEQFRDLAALEALEGASLIDSHIRLSDKMRRTVRQNCQTYAIMIAYFGTALK